MNPPWESPGICRHCNEDPCTKDYLDCIRDAHEKADDEAYDRMRDGQ